MNSIFCGCTGILRAIITLMEPTAEKAIGVLQKLEQECGSAALAYFVLPNVILTLSGARAYADNVCWTEDTANLKSWYQELSGAFSSLKTTTSLIYSAVDQQQPPSGDIVGVSYELILSDGLDHVLGQTSLVSGLKPQDFVSCTNLPNCLQIIIDRLRPQEKFRSLDNENMNHIAYGILLGYPDTAILGAVKLWQQSDPFGEPLIAADIRGAVYYACAQPVYDYPRSIVTDDVVRQHEALWSGILKDFYTSEFHLKLAADLAFQAKMKKLGNYR
jgi:hypothetical protein